jgi:hypothetical protein
MSGWVGERLQEQFDARNSLGASMDGSRSFVVFVGHRHCAYQQALSTRLGGVSLVACNHLLLACAGPASGIIP